MPGTGMTLPFAKDQTMMNRPYQRWIALLAVPVFLASTLSACQRSGEDTGASSGASSGGASQSGDESSPRSERQGSPGSESQGEKSPSR